jgi:hypothetical protein
MCKSSLHRECLHCGTSFEAARKDKVYCSPQCIDGARYYRNQEKRREDVFKRKYGITFAQRDAMYAEQEGKCKVCDTHMTWDHRKDNTVHVDHCHTSGEVKGLLCANCNTAAGLLGENPKIAASLVQYLLDTAKVPTR